MRQATTQLTVGTRGKGFTDITRLVRDWLSVQTGSEGLLTLFIRHTSASLLIQENADPDVLHDLGQALARLAPEGEGLYAHHAEGPDDMPAHIRSALTQTHLSIPVIGGELALGTWQGIYVAEHRARPHTRTVALHVMLD